MAEVNKWGQERFGAQVAEVQNAVQKVAASMNNMRNSGMFNARSDAGKTSDIKALEEMGTFLKIVSDLEASVSNVVKNRPTEANDEAIQQLTNLESTWRDLISTLASNLGVNVADVMSLDSANGPDASDAKRLQLGLNKGNIFESAPTTLSPVR